MFLHIEKFTFLSLRIHCYTNTYPSFNLVSSLMNLFPSRAEGQQQWFQAVNCNSVSDTLKVFVLVITLEQTPFDTKLLKYKKCVFISKWVFLFSGYNLTHILETLLSQRRNSFCTVLCTLFSCYALNYTNLHTTDESSTMQTLPRNLRLKSYSVATAFAGSRWNTGHPVKAET